MSRTLTTTRNRTPRSGEHRTTLSWAVAIAARLACALLAAIHLTPLWRTVRHIIDQGPIPTLVATGAILVLLIALLAAKAAGVVFFSAGTRRRASIVAFVTAAALFHGDALVSKNLAPPAAVLTVSGAAVAAAAALATKVGEPLFGLGRAWKSLFLTTLWGRLTDEPMCVPVCPAPLGAKSPRGPPRRFQA